MIKIKTRHLSFFLIFFTYAPVFSQSVVKLDMEQVISYAHSQSIESMSARNTFLGDYWSFRSHKAELLPALNLTTSIANFDRSQRALQNAETGSISYINNYNMFNEMRLSIDQQIAATGGTISLNSNLSRLDQYKPTRYTTYYSQPITLSYLQPLWSYNRLKWDKKTEPLEFERAKRQYLENMENITVRAVSMFYNVISASMDLDIARTNYENTCKMFSIAQHRFKIGSIKKDEILQLELRLLNDSLYINNLENNLTSTQMAFNSFLGFRQNTEIELKIPEDIPELLIDQDFVLDKVMENSSFMLSQKLTELYAERDVAQAKANRGVSARVSANLGFSQNSEKFSSAYSNLLEHEVVGLTLSIPIMDWGMGKGRTKVAQARAETTRNRIQQDIIDYQQDVYMQVLQFNLQRRQCEIARRALDISEERYSITMENFATGTVSVTDLNTAQSEKDNAQKNYITQTSNFWLYYYQLRKATLYDFLSKTDISAEYDELIK